LSKPAVVFLIISKVDFFETAFSLTKGYHLVLGLPDGMLANIKSQFGYISEGLGLLNLDIFYLWLFGIFYCTWVNLIEITYILGSFGTFLSVIHMYYVVPKKSGNPALDLKTLR
jgi:hypothetical protein